MRRIKAVVHREVEWTDYSCGYLILDARWLMFDKDSPYRPPAALEINSEGGGTEEGSAFASLAMVLLPLFGGFFGFAGYLSVALMLELHWVRPRATMLYGQQAGMISLPICAITGAAIGLGVAFAIVRRYVVSIVLLVMVSLCGGIIVNVIWNDQIASEGRDASEVVLYYPPLALSMLALVVALVVANVAAVHLRSRIL